jgi:RHS repeat-associated protein
LQEETGQYDYGARFYDPVIARWGVIDPMGEKFSMHSPYAYVGNNPMKMIDPNGKEDQEVTGAYGEVTHGEHWSFDGSAPNLPGNPSADQTSSHVTVTAFMSEENKPKPKSKLSPALTNTLLKRSGTVNSWLNYAGTGSGFAGALQIGMSEYRESLPIMSKIGTFAKFSAEYRLVGVTGKVLGGASTYVGGPLNTYLDYRSMRSGEIGAGRFAYRTSGTLFSTFAGPAIGAEFGGPYGALAGALIQGGAWAGEKSYDGFMSWLDATSKYISDFNRAVSNGWVPGK